jgi:glycosyltransferase involved in cell wall biosynthesis
MNGVLDIDPITIVTPAFGAQDHLAGAVRSVLAQSYPHWRMMIVSDDGVDYEALLGRQGIADPRLGFLSTGVIKGGASRARNLALARAESAWCAVLDADDRFKPEKLARVSTALEEHAIVTTALDVMRDDGTHLRTVGAGPDRLLDAGAHKWLNLSMDTMIAWDRRRCDGRYATDQSNMTDLEFLMQLYQGSEDSFHIGTPLHDYVKRSVSMSNGPGVTAGMVGSKRQMLKRLADGRYDFASPTAHDGIRRFLEVSLAAEESFDAAMAQTPGLIFEDHLEPMLRAAEAD